MTGQRPGSSAGVRPSDLSPAQHRAIVALVGSGSTSDAATAAGVTDRSIRRWLTDPVFAAEYRAMSRSAAAEATTALLAAQRAAVDALRAALTAPSPATRVRAARALLDIGTRVLDDDIDQRIEDLEREVARWRDAPRGLSIV